MATTLVLTHLCDICALQHDADAELPSAPASEHEFVVDGKAVLIDLCAMHYSWAQASLFLIFAEGRPVSGEGVVVDPYSGSRLCPVCDKAITARGALNHAGKHVAAGEAADSAFDQFLLRPVREVQ